MGSVDIFCCGVGVGSGAEISMERICWRSGCIRWLFSVKKLRCKCAIVVGGASIVARYCLV